MVATLEGPGLNGPQILGNDNTLGVTDDNTIVLHDPETANYHARIALLDTEQATVYAIVDTGQSLDGTFVNGKRIDVGVPYVLNTGDIISFGQQTWYVFEYGSEYGSSGALISGAGFNKISVETVMLGSDNSNTFVADSSAASHHATISVFQPAELYGIMDLGGSGDGTRVNQKQLLNNGERPQILNAGDEITIGRTEYIFKQGDFYEQESQPVSEGCSISGIIMALFLIAIVIGGIYLYASQNQSAQGQSTPQTTLTAFCNAVKDGDYQTAYNQLSKKVQSQGTEAQFAAQLKQIFAQQRGLKDCKVGKIQAKSNSSVGTITYVFKNGKTRSYSDTLVNESNSWKISSSQY